MYIVCAKKCHTISKNIKTIVINVDFACDWFMISLKYGWHSILRKIKAQRQCQIEKENKKPGLYYLHSHQF